MWCTGWSDSDVEDCVVPSAVPVVPSKGWDRRFVIDFGSPGSDALGDSCCRAVGYGMFAKSSSSSCNVLVGVVEEPAADDSSVRGAKGLW